MTRSNVSIGLVVLAVCCLTVGAGAFGDCSRPSTVRNAVIFGIPLFIGLAVAIRLWHRGTMAIYTAIPVALLTYVGIGVIGVIAWASNCAN